MALEILDSKIMIDSPPWLRVVSETVRLPNGDIVHEFMRVEQPPYAANFLVTKDQRVPFIRQYKHGPPTISLQLPAGYIDCPVSEPVRQFGSRK